jgi:type VI protein secretion system component VasK
MEDEKKAFQWTQPADDATSDLKWTFVSLESHYKINFRGKWSKEKLFAISLGEGEILDVCVFTESRAPQDRFIA